MADAVLLVAHGSPRARWREPFERILQSVREALGSRPVALSYLGSSEPSMAEAFAQLAASGAGSVRVIPLFLSGGGHVTREVEPAAHELAQQHGLQVEVLSAIGEDPRFRALVCMIAGED